MKMRRSMRSFGIGVIHPALSYVLDGIAGSERRPRSAALLDPPRDPGGDFRLDPADASSAEGDRFRKRALRDLQVNRASGKTRSRLYVRQAQDGLCHHDTFLSIQIL